MHRPPSFSDYWDAKAKLGMVFETAGMYSREFDAYCHAQGLLPVQVLAWKKAFEATDYNQGLVARAVREAEQEGFHPSYQRRQHHGSREFKESALAKAAALLGD